MWPIGSGERGWVFENVFSRSSAYLEMCHIGLTCQNGRPDRNDDQLACNRLEPNGAKMATSRLSNNGFLRFFFVGGAGLIAANVAKRKKWLWGPIFQKTRRRWDAYVRLTRRWRDTLFLGCPEMTEKETKRLTLMSAPRTRRSARARFPGWSDWHEHVTWFVVTGLTCEEKKTTTTKKHADTEHAWTPPHTPTRHQLPRTRFIRWSPTLRWKHPVIADANPCLKPESRIEKKKKPCWQP